MSDELTLDDYPQLALLAWNRKVRKITGAEAFALYEANWRFVERPAPNEQLLIERLTQRYGRGVMNVSSHSTS